MTNLALVRYHLPGASARIGVLRDEIVYDVTDAVGSVAEWLRSTVGRVPAAIDDLAALATVAGAGIEAGRFDQAPAPEHAVLAAACRQPGHLGCRCDL